VTPRSRAPSSRRCGAWARARARREARAARASVRVCSL
jgi:hypothetical protein